MSDDQQNDGHPSVNIQFTQRCRECGGIGSECVEGVYLCRFCVPKGMATLYAMGERIPRVYRSYAVGSASSSRAKHRESKY